MEFQRRMNWPSWNLEMILGSFLAAAPASVPRSAPSMWLHLFVYVSWSQVGFPENILWDVNVGTENVKSGALGTDSCGEVKKTGLDGRRSRPAMQQHKGLSWSHGELWSCDGSLNLSQIEGRGGECLYVPHSPVLGGRLPLRRGCNHGWGAEGTPGRGSVETVSLLHSQSWGNKYFKQEAT